MLPSFHQLNKSLIARAGFAMAAIALVTLATTLTSAYITDRIEGHAAAINKAGVLRMYTYKLATHILSTNQSFEDYKRALENDTKEQSIRLTDPILLNIVPKADQYKLHKVHSELITTWETTIALPIHQLNSFNDIDQQTLIQQLTVFAEQADFMVVQIQLNAEDRVRQMKVMQWIGICLILFIIIIAMIDLSTNIRDPLRSLVKAANAARRGDFSKRITPANPDELGTLADAFNMMAEDLSKLYSHLEFLVEQKTQELQISNQVLQLLYHSATKITEEKDHNHSFQLVLDNMRNTLHFKSLSLCLADEYSDNNIFNIISSNSSHRPDHCTTSDCNTCLNETNNSSDKSTENRIPTTDAQTNMLKFPVQRDQKSYGHIFVEASETHPMEEWKSQIITTISDNIATHLSLEEKADQDQRLSLMEERTVIARELHDSLAQSLSYQKIQVARLKASVKRNESKEKIDLVIQDLSEGLNSAYKQLRELLTTFRLKLSEANLRTALQNTVTEFNERSDLKIDLSFNIGSAHLRPNEEIHILQIVREALSNVLQHAKASHAEVALQHTTTGIDVTIRDNGVGIPNNPEQHNHYGLAIMNERALGLNGKISIKRRPSNGTEVILKIPNQTVPHEKQA
ncbi:MAG: HAMP domain-containing protein [Pseudomonadales bacterium]|nr:HAMP domain-containing protein [Pseudomonadales bacterium]